MSYVKKTAEYTSDNRQQLTQPNRNSQFLLNITVNLYFNFNFCLKMDLFLLCGIAISLLGVIISLYFFQKQRNAQILELQSQQQRGGNNVRNQDGIPRRAQIVRNQRNRLRGAATSNDQSQNNVDVEDDDDDDDNEDNHSNVKFDDKMGTKKRAKLEAKAEKRAQREAELQLREERKKKEAALEEQRKIEEKKAEEEERKQQEAERKAKEEKERKEHEEYLKMKQAFSIEEEGFEENDEDEQNLLQEFIQYIKDNKVVILEDVASHFKLKTQQVIERIEELRENGSLTGVLDDRGKFIYISEKELQDVAKFIKQRGRVSISELAESSNNLININSIQTNA